MRVATGLSHFSYLVIERLPVALKNMPSRNDDIDFLGTRSNAFTDFLDAEVKRGQPGRKPGRDGGNWYT